MSVDGFRTEHAQAFGGFQPDVAARFHTAVNRVARRLRVQVDGVENVPEGPALLVANHAFGWDIAFPMAAVYEKTGRCVFALGEHLWWKVPVLRRVAAAVGTVDGTPENVDRLLEAGHIVLVLPGGMREAMKPHQLRYRLMWGRRFGFVRAAVKAGAPMIPLAALGADELFDWVGDPYARGKRLLRRLGLRDSNIPIPRPRFSLPIPHRIRLRYVFGEPVYPDIGPDRLDDAKALRRLRYVVEGELQELIDVELARRVGIET